MTPDEAGIVHSRILGEIRALEKCIRISSSLEDKVRFSITVLKKIYLAANYECIIDVEENEELIQNLKTMYEEIVCNGSYIAMQVCGMQRIKVTPCTISILGQIAGSLKGSLKAINYYKKSQYIELVG